MKHFEQLEASLKSLNANHQISLTKSLPLSSRFDEPFAAYTRNAESPLPASLAADNERNATRLAACACGWLRSLFCYITIAVCLYVLVALARHNLAALASQQQQRHFEKQVRAASDGASAVIQAHSAGELDAADTDAHHSALVARLAALEARQDQNERHIEVLALNLQAAETRLGEREKCDCPVSCSFNNTRFADGSQWQSACDDCRCKSGRIYCAPRKCPVLACEAQLQEPGKCCPVCMKQCKYKNATIGHNRAFTPSDNAATECKCHDGVIKCERKEAPKGRLYHKLAALRATPSQTAAASSSSSQAS